MRSFVCVAATVAVGIVAGLLATPTTPASPGAVVSAVPADAALSLTTTARP